MFLTDIYSHDGESGGQGGERGEANQTLQVETHTCDLEENGVRPHQITLTSQTIQGFTKPQ